MLSRALLLLFITCSLHSQETYKIALGSCLHQDHPAPIWNAVKDNNIDFFSIDIDGNDYWVFQPTLPLFT